MKNKNNDPDFHIIQQVREGNINQFRFIVDKYKDVALSLACSFVHDKEDAEDCLQEAFLSAYNSLSRFRYTCSFSTWLYKIVVNVCRSRLRKLKNQHLYIEQEETYKTFHDHSGYDVLIEKERKKLINLTLAQLSADDALLLKLYYLAEKSMKEIKMITGFSESKIKVTLHRARKRFNEEFQKFSGDAIPWTN